MRTFICTLLIGFFATLNLSAQTGYKITIELDGFDKDTIILGYYLGGNQYVLDTMVRQNDMFIFEGEQSLTVGMYIIILPPVNDVLQILIDEDQRFHITADYKAGIKNIRIKECKENELFYSYVNFIQEQKEKSTALKLEFDSLPEDSDNYPLIQSDLKALDDIVKEKMATIISKHPDSYTTLILKSNLEITLPEFEGTAEEVKMKKFQSFKREYYERLQLHDKRMYRTPFLFDKLNYFTDKLTIRTPDSISISVDQILTDIQQHEDEFKFYLVHFLNKYAKSKIVGQDGVYVHLVDNYYAQGKAPWTNEDQLAKILKNARQIRPTLVGKVAPNLTFYNREDEIVNLHDVEAEFIVLYFYSPDCGHCKKSTPKLVEFYKNHQDKGVSIIAICGKMGKDYPSCWDYVDKTEDMNLLYNLGDEKNRTRFKSIYYVKTTPKLFVLNRDKKIISKGIGVKQLPELFKLLLEQEEVK